MTVVFLILAVAVIIVADIVIRNNKFDKEMERIRENASIHAEAPSSESSKVEPESTPSGNSQPSGGNAGGNVGVDAGTSSESAANTNAGMNGEARPGIHEELVSSLMRNTLTQIGCQPATNEDGSIDVAFQGEHFHMEFGGAYVRIWDPGWSQINISDPTWPTVREAINRANYGFGPTIVYSVPNDEGIISTHSRRDILFHPSLPGKDEYLMSVLATFFHIKDRVRAEYQNLTEQSHENVGPRRPVGFDTTAEENQN